MAIDYRELQGLEKEELIIEQHDPDQVPLPNQEPPDGSSWPTDGTRDLVGPVGVSKT